MYYGECEMADTSMYLERSNWESAHIYSNILGRVSSIICFEVMACYRSRLTQRVG